MREPTLTMKDRLASGELFWYSPHRRVVESREPDEYTARVEGSVYVWPIHRLSIYSRRVVIRVEPSDFNLLVPLPGRDNG